MAFEKLNSEEYSEGDRVMYEAGLSQDFRTQILENSEKINLNFCEIKENVQNIDKIKNELSKNLKEIYQHFGNLFDW